jgi:hypothetical protein
VTASAAARSTVVTAFTAVNSRHPSGDMAL